MESFDGVSACEWFDPNIEQTNREAPSHFPFAEKLNTKNDRAVLDNRKYHTLCLNYIQRQSLVLLVKMHWITLSRFPSSSTTLQQSLCVVSRPYIALYCAVATLMQILLS